MTVDSPASMDFPSSHGRSASRTLLLSAVAFAFLATLLLGIWKNDFPFYYHVDEPSKARQILTGERNLHHPLLLLSSTELLLKLGLAEPTSQAVTEAGRTVSAFFNAGAAAFLTFVMGAALGPLAGWATAFFAATHWNIFELSHYFKEDPSLAFGIMSVFAAIAWWRRRPGGLRAVAMGVALALALSGKYIGVIVVPFVILTWYFHRPAHPWKSAGLLMAAWAVVFFTVNMTMLVQPEILQASLRKETLGVLKGGEVATHGWFHAGFFKRIFQVSRIALLPGLLFLLIFGWKRWRQLPVEALSVISFPVVLAVVLGFSQKDSGRYFLPGVFGLCAASALGWKWWLEYVSQSQNHKGGLKALTVIAALVSIIGAGERLADYAAGFGQGTREEVAAWIQKNLPPSAIIAQSVETKLPDPSVEGRDGVEKIFSQKLVTIDRLASKATLESLRAQGVTHLVATESEWRDYMRGGKVRESRRETFLTRQRFWMSVLENGKPIWECEAGKVGTHNPPVKLWQIQ